MERISETRKKCLLVAATDNWRERIANELAIDVEEIRWCPDVYDLVATAAEMERQHHPTLAIVMIDHLPAREMQVFGCLSRMTCITSAAVSAMGNPAKMSQARTHGADESLTLADAGPKLLAADKRVPIAKPPMPKTLSGVPEEKIKEQSPQPQQTKETIEIVAVESVNSTLTKMAQQAIESANKTAQNDLLEKIRKPLSEKTSTQPQPVRTPPVREKVKQSTDPLLSREELDALLG